MVAVYNNGRHLAAHDSCYILNDGLTRAIKSARRGDGRLLGKLLIRDIFASSLFMSTFVAS